MTDLSDRQQDAFDNPAKMTCREGNLRVLREAAFLLWADGDRNRLRCDWCELMGETGFLTLDLLEREGVLAPGGFVGIDLDPARIDGFRQRRRDLTSAMLLPEGSETAIDAGFIGVLGAFEIYRGSIRGHRMAKSQRLLVGANSAAVAKKSFHPCFVPGLRGTRGQARR